MVVASKNRVTEIGSPPTNGAAEDIALSEPYTAIVILEGTSDMLFHRWNVEGVEEKAKAAKGSKAKKTDNVESYVFKDDKGDICIPGEYVRQSIIHAAKYRQDPRSPRKSAMDLFKAGVVSTINLAPVCRGMVGQGAAGCGMPLKNWEYEDRRRVTVQRAGITRTRPAIKAGWKAEFQFLILLPEYIRPADLQDVLTNAGRLVGLGDFRPTFGRFMIVKFSV